MNNIYFYKLTADNGGAPCLRYGLLSLAICKPMIRKTARKGDLVFGFAANSLHRDNRLIYVARITKKLCGGEYYKNSRYSGRRDCIYQLSGTRFVWKKNSMYHGPEEVHHDLGQHPDYPRANVLLSRDFRYFGREGAAQYKSRFPLVREAVQRLGRGARVRHNEELRRELIAMADWLWRRTTRKVVGKQQVRRRGKFACETDHVEWCSDRCSRTEALTKARKENEQEFAAFQTS
jgi:hypothetical protein